MSKKSRKRNRLILAGAALFGASKLGLLGGKSTASNVVGKTPEFRKSFVKDKPVLGKTKDFRKSFTTNKKVPKLSVTSTGDVIKKGVNTGVGNKKTLFANYDANVKSGTGIYQGGKKIKDLNPKAINILSDGKISSGGKTYADKKAYSSAMKIKRGERSGGGVKNFLNKFMLGEKWQLKSKGGTMVKARGGGMARNKPTKLY